MSSYAQLKELALKKAEEEQAALNRERERKEREAAAKLAAREAQEREQKEQERKILVHRMARQKEEEARERLRKEQAVKMQQGKVADDEIVAKAKAALASKQNMASSSKLKSSKASGSTQKIDLSDRLRGSSSNRSAPRRKRKADEDDFVGNRLDKSPINRTERSASSSAPKKKAVPLTREEKQAMKRAREFGSLPKLPPIGRLTSGSGSSRNSPSLSSGEAESASRLSARAHLAKDNGLVALGTKKRDHRSIDEIERDLRKLKEAKGQGRNDGPSQAELEREAALLRRQKAMEEKRKADQEAKERAALLKAENGDGDGSKDDLFGSDEDADDSARRKSSQAKTSKPSERSKTSTNGAHNGSAPTARPPAPTQPKEHKPNASRAPGGINPADFFPGAPLRPEAMARLSQKAKSTPDAISSRRSPDSDSAPQAKRSAAGPKSSPAPAGAASPAAPPKRETARDRFIREQEEKKKAAAAWGGNGGAGKDRRSRSPDDYDSQEEDYEDEYESDGVDDDDDGGGGGQSYRDEIWKLFGKDRKKYASRVVDSDDDMEADAASVLQEELRSSKQAREEDLREEQLEKQREREKLLRKQALKRGSGR
ncbi:hypothetical protein NDA16_000587 [Ustilago loliicola]|nr:hypothetical protein NDA16_000587 [Ustilago loliicola]